MPRKSLILKDPFSIPTSPFDIEANEITNYVPSFECNWHNFVSIISRGLITWLSKLHQSKTFPFKSAVPD
jgi:hypothetical protein